MTAPRETAPDVDLAREAAVERLEAAGAGEIEGALVLGSGLSYLADEIDDPVRVPYDAIPGFPRSTVEGHAGNFVVGELEGVRVGFAQGRFHLYEGYPAAAIVLPVRVLHGLGARWLLVTNAAGSLDRRVGPGSLMAIRDQINLQFANPLIGRSPEAIDDPFPDMSAAYDPGLLERLRGAAMERGVRLHEGVYVGVSGPSYETPAEVRMLAAIGADAVGMSTVGETIAAVEVGLAVAGVSLITNYATGITAAPLDHAEVTEVAEATHDVLEGVVRAFVREGATLPIEKYSLDRKAELLLNNAVDEEDYTRAREEVKRLGLDPDSIAHEPP